jgi:hypothetical protein
MKLRNAIFGLIASLASGCIGVDHIDDPIMGEQIEIEQPQVALQIGETHAVKAIYYDQYGIQKDVSLTWISSAPAIATRNYYCIEWWPGSYYCFV